MAASEALRSNSEFNLSVNDAWCQRHAREWVRAEIGVGDQSDETYTLLRRKGGYCFYCRCTACGVSAVQMYSSETGEHVDLTFPEKSEFDSGRYHWSVVTVAMLWDALPWKNPDHATDGGGHIKDTFVEHF